MINKNITVGVIGLGYVGLPLMLRCAESGFSVIGFDIDANKIDQLNQGRSYIKHIDSNRIFKIWQSQQYQTTTDFSRISEADILVLCVPTPLGQHREPDLSFVLSTINSLLPYLRQGQLISLESTTYPGTTEEELRPLIEQKGFKI
ncbi:MAG: NAD(P)-binding domain-containing protein, partial [Dolichospermum sp.]